jgi:small conductance mechanosensitive channel
MEELYPRLIDWGSLYGLKIVGALAILIIGRIAVGMIVSLIRRLMLRGKVDETLVGFISNIVRVLLLAFVFIAALNNLGVQTTSLIAILGAAGLAIGLALQGSLANFASGVMLIVFRPFTKGEYVEAGGTSGSVEEIRIFNTVLKTPDNKVVVVPNGNIIGGNITNYSREETRRLDMVVGVGYNDDLKQVKAVLTELVKADPRILEDPAPTIAVLELGDNSVNLAVRPWVKTADYWGVHFDLTEKIKITFDERGISIPYPQRDVHMYQQTVA